MEIVQETRQAWIKEISDAIKDDIEELVMKLVEQQRRDRELRALENLYRIEANIDHLNRRLISMIASMDRPSGSGDA